MVRHRWRFNDGSHDPNAFGMPQGGGRPTLLQSPHRAMKRILFFSLSLFAAVPVAQALGPILANSSPAISENSVDVTVEEGQPAQFSVLAFGFPFPSFQWLKDGVAIPGANTSVLRFDDAQLSDAGYYQVLISNSQGSVYSRNSLLTVMPLPARIMQQPATIVREAGQSASFNVVASSNLALSYQWYRNGALLPGATSSSLTLANVTRADVGSYHVTVKVPAEPVTKSDGTVGPPERVFSSAQAALTIWAAPGEAAQLSAVSARSVAGTGDRTLIAGFIIGGAATGTRPMLIRGLGPALTQFNVSPVLGDPRLNLFDGGARLMATNDDWGGGSGLSTRFAALGLSPLPAASKDAALSFSLSPGTYTVHVLPATGTAFTSSDIALLELYDAGSAADPGRLNALSVRGEVAAGDGTLIVGFVVSGTGSRNLIIRGLGPALAQLGIPNALTDPSLALRAGNNLIQFNDDWGGDPTVAAEFAAAGLGSLPAGSKDAALLVTLPAGVYTVQLSPARGQVGIGSIEIYEVR
jgi:hypothetical protein